MNLTTPRNLTLSLVATMALSAGLAAQSWGTDIAVGTADYNARLALRAAARIDAGTLSSSTAVSGSATGRLTMAGRRVEAFRLAGASSASSGLVFVNGQFVRRTANTTDLTLRIAGYTLLRRSTSTNSTITSAPTALRLFGSTGVDQDVTVGPFVVTVNGNAVNRVEIGAQPLWSPRRLGFQAWLDSDLNARWDASVGAFGVAVGVRTVFDLPDPVADVEVSSDLIARTSRRTFTWGLERGRLMVEAFASAWGFTWANRIVDTVLPARSGSLGA